MCLNRLQKHFFQPEVDLFASTLNHKVDKYILWKPDLQVLAVDALLHKTEKKLAEGILVSSCWTTQAWFPQAIRMLVSNPRLLPKRDGVVFLPFNPKQKHPLQGRMNLMACHLSGNPSRSKEFLNGQLKFSLVPGEMGLRNNIKFTSNGGEVIVVQGKLIQLFDKGKQHSAINTAMSAL